MRVEGMAKKKIHGGKQVLPKDVIRSILVRLPVRSLIQFQCVCKEWKFLFKSPSFIAEHLQRSAHQKPFLFFDDYGKFHPYRAYLLNCEMRVLEIPSDPYVDTVRCVWAVNSCNGLICLAFSTLPPTLFLYVWNPAIREARLVHGGEDYLEDENFHIGFGFSSTVNDDKIVKIRDCDYGGLVSHVEVYSLNIGTWKEVKFGKLDDVVISSDGFYFNGAIFWIGSKLGADEDEDDIDIIVSFDIATELFTLIPMPPLPFPVTYGLYRKYLTIYENKLALLSHTLSDDFKSSLIHVWLMEEGTCAKGWCWTKKYTSSPYLGYLLVPVAIWRNEIVCNVDSLPRPIDQIDEDEDEPNGERKIVMLNFTNNEFKTIDIRRFVLGYGIFNYTDGFKS